MLSLCAYTKYIYGDASFALSAPTYHTIYIHYSRNMLCCPSGISGTNEKQLKLTPIVYLIVSAVYKMIKALGTNTP